MNDKRYLKVKMLNLEQEVQALLAKGENLGAGIFDTIADDIDRLTTQIMDLRKKSQPTTAADTQAPEAEVKETTILSLESLYNEIKAVPGNTGLGNEDNEDMQMYYLVDDDGNVNKLGKLNPDELKKAEAELEGNGFIMSEEDFKEFRNIE
jgi:hypothetical protein